MKISIKLLVTYVLVVMLVMSIGGLALFMNLSTNDKLDGIQDKYWVGTRAMMDFRANIYAIQGNAMCYVNNEPEAIDEIDETKETIEVNVESITESGIFGADELTEITTSLDEYYVTIDSVIDAVDSGNASAVIVSVEDMDSSTMEFEESLLGHVETAQLEMEAQLSDLEGSLTATNTAILVTMAAVLVIGLAVAVAMARSISAPIIRMTKAADDISSGAGQVQFLNIESKDEIGDLGRSFDRMINSVKLAYDMLDKKE